jgi:predicted aspartyl protease
MLSQDRRRVTAGLAAALALPARAEPPTVALPPEPAPSQTLETSLDRFTRMTAPVMINGQGPFAFVVDTGANQTVISQELAASLGLATGESRLVHDVAGAEMASTVIAAELKVAGRLVRQVSLPALPRSSMGAAGILGLDQLRNQRVRLDFRSSELTIGRSHFEPTPAFTTAIRARQRSGQLTIVDSDLSGIPVAAFLDSGAERTVGNLALYELAALKVRQGQFFDAPIVSVTGRTILGRMALLPTLRLGGVRIVNIVVTFADLHVFQIWNLKQPALLIGMDSMRAFDSITLDFGRSEVWFEHAPRRG